MANYFNERDKKFTLRLRELRDTLPEFCDEFFIGIEPLTTPMTRLYYAYDLRIFFDYLMQNVRAFRNYTDMLDFTVSDLEKITTQHLEAYLEYLSLYEYDGKEYTNGSKGKARKISTVRAFFKYYFNHDRISSNVAAKLTMPKQRDKEIIRLEDREVSRILDVAEYGEGMTEHQRKIQRNTRYRDVAILTLLLGTGIRVSECVGLNLSDIDFDTNAFTVTRKGGNRAILYFGDEVAVALQEYIDSERKALINRCEKLAPGDTDALFLSLQVRRISVRAVENLVKKYRQRTVVNHVSIDVTQGEIVGLLGPNGAGKTTTFYMTTGLITPNEGQIYLNNKNITKYPVYKRAQNGIGYLAQEASVFRKMSVENNIRSILEMTDMTKEEQRDKLENLIAEFRLEKVRHNLGDQLSGGERRRTEIARCLAINPKFIMLDEPFAGVDPIAVEDIQEVVYKLKSKNIGILITDHNAQETLRITDRAYLLFEGKILFQGTSEELAANPIVREKYLGRNFIFHRKQFN